MTCTRWHEGDVDEHACSLYADRGNGGRKKAKEEQPAAEEPSAPDTPASAAQTPFGSLLADGPFIDS